jgi:hypothetical protein
MKNTDHPTRHPRVHRGDRARAAARRLYVRKNNHFGRGQNTVLGWSDPTFGQMLVAKRPQGSLQPNINFLRCLARVRSRILDEIGEGRRLIR